MTSAQIKKYFLCTFYDYEANIAPISTNFFCFHMSLIYAFFHFLIIGVFPITSFEIMAFKSKTNCKIFNLTLFQSLLHHGYCRYSTAKLKKAYSISWLDPVKIWRILVEFCLSSIENRTILLQHINLSHSFGIF